MLLSITTYIMEISIFLKIFINGCIDWKPYSWLKPCFQEQQQKLLWKKGLMRLHSSFLCIHTNNQYSSLRGGSNGNSCCKASFHLLCTRTTGALALFCLWEFFKQKGNRERWEPKSKKETKNRKNKIDEKHGFFFF